MSRLIYTRRSACLLPFPLVSAILNIHPNREVCQGLMEAYMRKERINLYITERQRKQVEKRSTDEDLPMAEIIRRALDVYLAWDDPGYRPISPSRPERKGHSSPS